MAESVVNNMERALSDRGYAPLSQQHLSQRRAPTTERDLEAARDHVRNKQRKLAARQARLARLEDETHERNDSTRAFTMFRLHSVSHYIECSQRRFAEWSSAQRFQPIWLTTESGRRWWWYSDRFWWDDEGLRADKVKSHVFELDLEAHRQHDAAEQLQADLFGRQRDPSS